MLHTPLKALGKGWLTLQKRYWHDDNCSDPLLAEAIAHGWSLKAVILVGSNEAASFTVSAQATEKRDRAPRFSPAQHQAIP